MSDPADSKLSVANVIFRLSGPAAAFHALAILTVAISFYLKDPHVFRVLGIYFLFVLPIAVWRELNFRKQKKT